MKKIFYCIIILLFIYMISFVSSIIPIPENDLPFPSLRHCTSLCDDAWWQCDSGCSSGSLDCSAAIPEEMLNLDEINGFLYKCSQDNKDKYWPCRNGCDRSAASCYASCKQLIYGTPYDARIKPSEFKKLEEAQGCKPEETENGCCPGYHLTKLGVCCSEGYEAFSTDGIVNCAPDEKEEVIEEVKVELGKQTMLLDSYDFIPVQFKFSGTDENGKKGPLAGKIYATGYRAEGTGAEYEVHLLTKETDPKGIIKAKIVLKKLTDTGNIGPVTTYHIKGNDKKTFAPKLPDYELKVSKKGSKTAWHDSWGNYIATVNDQKSVLKRYTINSGDGLARFEGNEGFIVYKSTKDNSVNFAWKAPKISEEVRIQYSKRVAEGLMNIGLIVLEDSISIELEDMVWARQMFSEQSKSNFDSFIKTIKLDTQGKTFGKSLSVDTEKTYYGRAAEMVDQVSWVEGTIGIAFPADKLSVSARFQNLPGGKKVISRLPLVTLLKTGASGLKDWYNTVDDMEKTSKAEKIVQYHSFTVDVESIDGSQKAKTFVMEVPVEGYERLLVE